LAGRIARLDPFLRSRLRWRRTIYRRVRCTPIRCAEEIVEPHFESGSDAIDKIALFISKMPAPVIDIDFAGSLICLANGQLWIWWFDIGVVGPDMIQASKGELQIMRCGPHDLEWFVIKQALPNKPRGNVSALIKLASNRIWSGGGSVGICPHSFGHSRECGNPAAVSTEQLDTRVRGHDGRGVAV
jgi:hypothetical protein